MQTKIKKILKVFAICFVIMFFTLVFFAEISRIIMVTPTNAVEFINAILSLLFCMGGALFVFGINNILFSKNKTNSKLISYIMIISALGCFLLMFAINGVIS